MYVRGGIEHSYDHPTAGACGRPPELSMGYSQHTCTHSGKADRRNLYLAREGHIEEGSAAWEAMSEYDRCVLGMLSLLSALSHFLLHCAVCCAVHAGKGDQDSAAWEAMSEYDRWVAVWGWDSGQLQESVVLAIVCMSPCCRMSSHTTQRSHPDIAHILTMARETGSSASALQRRRTPSSSHPTLRCRRCACLCATSRATMTRRSSRRCLSRRLRSGRPRRTP